MTGAAERTIATTERKRATTAVSTPTAAKTDVTTATNNNVAPLTESIGRDGCGSTKLCAAEPTECDPSTGTDCFFFSANQTSGGNFEFQLSGSSAGYIAVTLSTDATLGGNDTTYVCANDRGNVRFIGAFLDNQELSQTSTLNANEVKGRVDNGNEILCTFKATVPASASRTTGFTIALSKGSYNSTTGALGNPDTVFKSPTLDLSNSNADVTNVLANTTSSTTTATPTTRTATVVSTSSQATVPQQSLTQALLITVSVLSLLML
ncbi:putative ferric-chelate reductase 1 [Synchiropus splendidus]|uniref:putative ferric-chelate reductase 1 n=1 Tax=Synchiropus splendidus TaxID=270530 RepID=UPI00237DBE13|nr:putative ferric-chelate reductase 1 [Synchiropus splendidus]